MCKRTITKVGLICSMLLCIMLVSGLTSAFAAEQIIMRVAHCDPADVYTSRKHAQLTTFKEYVDMNSGGRIQVQVHGAGALGGERELVEALMTGSLHASSITTLATFYPPQMIVGIPYLFPSQSVAWEVLDGPFGKKLSEGMLKKTGLRNLAFGEVGFKQFTNSKKPIHTPSDMKGLKFRVIESPLCVLMVKSLGGNPSPIPWTETYMALQTGVADGQDNPVAGIFMAKLHEVQKYCTMDNHFYGEDWFLINEKFYQSLPKDLQAVVAEGAKISATVSRGVQTLNSHIGISKLQKAGMQIYTPTPQEMKLFKQAAQEPVIKWLKTKVDPKLVDEALQAVAKASKK